MGQEEEVRLGMLHGQLFHQAFDAELKAHTKVHSCMITLLVSLMYCHCSSVEFSWGLQKQGQSQGQDGPEP